MANKSTRIKVPSGLRAWLVRAALFGVALSGCGLQNLRPSEGPVTQVADVPFQARNEGAGLRQRVLVLPFLDDKATRDPQILTAVRQSFATELAATRMAVVVNNQELTQDWGSLVTESREYDMKKVATLAHNLGVAAVIEGKVIDVKAQKLGDEVGLIRKVRARLDVVVRVRMIAAHNGREIMNSLKTAAIENTSTHIAERNVLQAGDLADDPQLVVSALQQAFRSLILSSVKTIEKLDWQGRVALVAGEKVYINAGRLSGIQPGDILRVTEEGPEVFDPETGLFVGQAPGRMKGTLEIVSYFGRDGAIGIVHSGSGFRENDRVELY